jgi:UDP-N-acetylmuramoylalanine--D-glutamate ligase
MYSNKKFGVFGLGISGVATVKFLESKNANFIAYDDRKNIVLGLSSRYPKVVNSFKDLSDASWQEVDCFILSPGIPDSHPIVKLAKQINAQIICDVELLYQENSHAKYIGITGTNGKSTTTSLVAHILRFNGLNVAIGGNIGIPVLELDIRDNIIYVIEMSSFQLDLCNKVKFDIALLLNITPDHLDRHGNMENYTNAKYKIFSNQTEKDSAIINVGLSHSSEMITFSEKVPANILVLDNKLHYQERIYDLPHNNSLLGNHNKQNIAASIAVCVKHGLSIKQIIPALSTFVGLNHRMQYLGEYNGVTFINDSKATNADSTEKALASFNNIIWIAGGRQKSGGISSLMKYFVKIKQVFLVGESQDEFAVTCSDELKWKKSGDLYEAYKDALAIMVPGDVVLFSPACSSYDQWNSFEERGNAFVELVKNSF